MFLNRIIIENFGPFKYFEVTDLNKVNIFLGHNSMGKTTLLNSLNIHNGACLRVNSLLREEPTKILTKNEEGLEENTFIDPFSIKTTSKPKQSIFHSIEHPYRINDFKRGSGITQLEIISNFAALSNYYFFLDNIEYGIHHNKFEKLCESLFEISAKNEQLFITTMSIEFVDTLLYTFFQKEEKDILKFFSLQTSKTPGVPEVWHLTGREALRSRESYSIELR